ncbi:hypothetical protein G6F43_006549 [Rhizopus delemar]|nr:hypothetical protein G6F43_006549 [Rhizopus delemar]
MGQSSSLENTESISENEEDQLHDSRRRRYKKIDVKSCSKNINESQEDDVTLSPLYSFFPNMNTAEAPSNCPEAMSSSIVETSNPLKEDTFKASKNVNNSVGLASKIIPKRPWSSYHLFQLANSSSNTISDSKARMIRSPRIQPKDNKGNETNRNISRGRIKFVEPPKPIYVNHRHPQLEELARQNADIDQLITMMQNHKVSDDNSYHLDSSRNDNNIPSSEFQFSFPSSQQQYVSPPLIHEDEDEGEATAVVEYQGQFKYDTIKNRKILPLPKRKLKSTADIKSGSNTSSNGSSPSIPTSPFTFSSDKTMPKVSFLTDASRNVLQQQQHQQQQQQVQDSVILLSSESNRTATNRKDRPSMSKKIKSMERVQTNLINDEKSVAATTTGKRKETSSNQSTFKTPPKMEVFTKYTPPSKDGFEFPNFNFQFNNSTDDEGKNTTISLFSQKPIINTLIDDNNSTTNDTNTNNLPNNKTSATYSHSVFAGKKETRKNLSAKPPSVAAAAAVAATKKPSNNHPATTAATTTKVKRKENDKKKPAMNKTTKKNKKSKNKKSEDIAPGGFLSSDITLFENPISDDWICFFCQFDIFCHGIEDAKKKNGYYRRKKERLRRTNEARRITGGVESSDDHFDEEHRHRHHHA